MPLPEDFDILFFDESGGRKKSKKTVKLIAVISAVCAAVAVAVFIIRRNAKKPKVWIMKRMFIEEIEKLDRNFLTPAEAAAAMEISLSTFYRNREKMNLPTVRSGRKIHIPKDAFLEFLRYGKTGDKQKWNFPNRQRTASQQFAMKKFGSGTKERKREIISLKLCGL